MLVRLVQMKVHIWIVLLDLSMVFLWVGVMAGKMVDSRVDSLVGTMDELMVFLRVEMLAYQ